MFCAECGQRLADGTNFCPRCGTPVAPVQPPSAEPPSSNAGAGSALGFDAAQASELARAIIERVKNIVLTPSTEWPVIAAEASSARTIYFNYVVPLVAIGAIAGFLGHSLVGLPLPLLGTIRVGIVAAFAHAIATFALSVVAVFVVALIVDALAPTFGGQKDPLAALKVTAYSYTPAWVASVLNLIPALGILVILAAFYGLYLLYLGLPVLMHTPKDKAVGYTVVTVLCAIVMGIVIVSLSSMVMGGSVAAAIP